MRVAAGGYEIQVQETINAATELGNTAAMAKAADTELRGIASLPAPEAGEGIGGAMKSFEAAWHAVLPALETELKALAKNVAAGATMTITVERRVGGRFGPFAP